jgi:hypothetical protein
MLSCSTVGSGISASRLLITLSLFRTGAMRTDAVKHWLKKRLESAGLYVRKSAGLPVGLDVFRDLERWETAPTIILDIGAHMGESCKSFSTKFPSVKIFAFEPVAANFQRLKVNTSNLFSVECINAGVGSTACPQPCFTGACG